MKPVQLFKPEESAFYNAAPHSTFLALDDSLSQTIEVILYNSEGSGWSYGKDQATGIQGWFPTMCCEFDVVTAL